MNDVGKYSREREYIYGNNTNTPSTFSHKTTFTEMQIKFILNISERIKSKITPYCNKKYKKTYFLMDIN